MQSQGDHLQITPATSLDEVYKTLRPYPLSTPEELQAFYRDEINATRGGDKMQRLRLRLNRAANDGVLFKACMMGHSGVGKSTELSRLEEQIKEKFQVIRFSAELDLNPGNFSPLDVVLVMMMEVAEKTADAVVPPSEQRLKEVKDWFATETRYLQSTQEMGATFEAGVGVEKDSLWAQISGLFARLKGEVKYSATRNQKLEDYRLSRVKDLIEVANRLLDDCNQLLQQDRGQQWLFIGEDFDKAGIREARIQELFITYGNLFQYLRTNLIFNVPIGLFYSSEATRLPFKKENSFVLPDTPIYAQDHQSNPQGRRAVQRRLGMSPFDPDEITYAEKAALLERIYHGEQDAQITDPTLYSLLRARAVQEFNGQRWFGIHPLVVDILKKQGKLPFDSPGGVSDGSQNSK